MTNTEAETVSAPEATNETEPAPWKMSLQVDISDSGPCRKRIHVVIPEGDLNHIRETVLEEYADKASVPGFRVGRVPRGLVESRFKRQLGDELKQRVLVQSLEQVTVEHALDPINEPDMDVETLEIPESGDFDYTFEVEVRPDVQLPDFTQVVIKRPVREVTDSDVEKYLGRLMLEFGEKTPHEGAAEPGDYVTCSVEFTYKGKDARRMSDVTLRLQPTLRFQDAEVSGFDQLMAGAKPGDSRSVDVTISKEAAYVPMRGEVVQAVFTVSEVKKFQTAVLDNEILARMGVESVDALRQSIRQILERQVVYRQRQSCRQQLLEQITESASWELPEELVMKQVENALHREILEMRQAGYTPKEIRARENQLRQHSVSVTRQAMKEHFVLDKIATEEKIEVTHQDMDTEILLMAFQSGETPRRVRARLEKTGVIENLEAQIRERKAVDFALERTKFEDVPLTEDLVGDLTVEAIDDAICNIMFARSTTGES